VRYGLADHWAEMLGLKLEQVNERGLRSKCPQIRCFLRRLVSLCVLR
jgi:hypothetical protein